LDLLNDKITNLPEEPGVYLMKNDRNKIIYVGKAKNLKKRVLTYFSNSDQSLKTKALSSEIRDFELILTLTEVEAILLERTLIKHHAPKYNILLRDDKQYPYLKIDYSEPWPRIRKVRKRGSDKASYIGPFSQAGHLDLALKTVQRIFPIVRCSEYEFRNARRPCNYYNMRMCLAPCTKNVDQHEYLATVQNAESLLRGNNNKLKKLLEKSMLKAAEAENFEKAALLRDQLKALTEIAKPQVAIVDTNKDTDVLGLYIADTTIVNVTIIRNRKIIGQENYELQNILENQEALLSAFISQYYEDRDLPQILIAPILPENSQALLSALQGEKYQSQFATGHNSEQKNLLKLAEKNARHFHQEISQLADTRRVELELLQKEFHLPVIPEKIECLDISNLHDTAIVAGIVCFINGKPAKSMYKKYNLKTVIDKPDDFSSIREVVKRRIKRGIEDGDFPDLLVIDGGKGQLSAALESKRLFRDIQLPIISIAKSRYLPVSKDFSKNIPRSPERVFVADKDMPIPLQPGSPIFRILTGIRDEAHRFAIGFHRKQRSKLFKKSQLDDIPGIGPTLKKRLLNKFKTLESIKRQTIDELKQVKGVSENLATRILAELNSDKPKI